MSKVYSAGIATAYGAAKKAGYQGTYQQFCEDQANFASNAASVARDKTAAQTAASNAESSATAASTAAGTATTAAGSAQGSAQAASGSASTASAEALKAEGWASGKQNGQDVPSSSPYYHKSAKYYADYAKDTYDSIPAGYDNMIVVSENEPQDEHNKIWFPDEDGSEVEEISIPTNEEFVALQSAINVLEDAVDAIHEVPAGGTSGQILTKVSGSDYDVQWSPVGMPSDEQVDEAVTDWLDDHPEATTTVEDGAITMQKLNSNLQDDIVIKQDTEQAYYHNVSPISVTFYQQSLAPSEPCRYIGSKEILASTYETGLSNGVTRTKAGRFLYLKGTSTGRLNFTNFSAPANFRGKTFNVYIYLKKSTNWESASYLCLNDGTRNAFSKDFSANSNTLIGWNKFENVSISENATVIRFRIDSAANDVFAEGDFVWIGMYEVPASEINTEHVITEDDPYTISVSGMNYVDTMLHESASQYVTPTKAYVDEHTPDIIGYWNDNVYAMPEKFGAVGDGITDDTTALQNSVNYAIQHLKPLRGFGKYKITSPLTLFAQNMDYMINEIVYTGTDAAVKASANYNKYEFNKITSGGIGFLAMKNGNSGFSYNVVVIKNIDAQSHAICFTGNGDSVFMLYNTFNVRKASSANGDVYHGGDGAVAQENTYYDTSCACPNGWAVNGCHGKMYNFTMESNVLNGIRLGSAQGAEFIGFRHREMTDKLVRRINGTGQQQGGTLIKFEGACSNVRFSTCDWIPYAAIDVSDATPISEMNVDTAANAQGLNTIDAMIRYGNLSSANGVYDVGRRMYVLGNKKICVPAYESVVENTYATYDMRDDAVEANQARVHPTKMIIGVDDSVIYLSTSYCSIGYSEFIVDQTDHLCTIYDCNDTTTPIFNGQQLGSGVYKLHAYCDVAHSGYGQQSDQVRMNTGANDLWEITKLS